MTAGDKKIHPWVQRYFQAGDSEKIHQAVLAAELKTTGDIVPMVVHKSADVSSTARTLFLTLYVLALLLHIAYFDFDTPFVFVSAAICLFISLVLSHFEFVQRWMLSGKSRQHEAHVRAELEFYRNHFDQTKSHGAVLIFVTILERKIVVLFDEHLAKKIPQNEWDKVSELVAESMKKGHLTDGLIAAIAKTGELLAQVLPVDGKASEHHKITSDIIIKE